MSSPLSRGACLLSVLLCMAAVCREVAMIDCYETEMMLHCFRFAVSKAFHVFSGVAGVGWALRPVEPFTIAISSLIDSPTSHGLVLFDTHAKHEV